MPTVRAKFHVQSKTLSSTGSKDAAGQPINQTSVKLTPVYGGSDENRKFFASSPSGSIELGIINQAAADQFEVGKSYYVDFTPAE
jgi:hypothetical protein